MMRTTAAATLFVLVSSCKSPASSPPKEAAPDAPPPASSPSPAPVASAAGPVKCGEATCGAGEFCCNESCSICAPTGGSCIMKVCEPNAGCKTDADCATWSSYCGDMPCACLAIEKAKGPPKCERPNAVKCLVDPCRNKAAACQSGACVVTAD